MPVPFKFGPAFSCDSGRAAEILETGRRGEALYSREQREAALEAYDRLGDVRAAVRELGYPSDTALAGWVRRRGEAPRPRKPAVRLDAHEKQG